MQAITHILYLHGFRSSPQSFKAQLLGQQIQTHYPHIQWVCPAIEPAPAKAMRQLHALVQGWPHSTMAVVGSSLGGFYATVLAQHYGCKAVLLNPAIHPAQDLAGYIGTQTCWHDPQTQFEFGQDDVNALRDMEPKTITLPQRYSVVIAKGDEVLSWQDMAQRYQHANILLLEGSDHALTDFGQHVPFVVSALGLAV